MLEQEIVPFAETLRDPAARERYLELDGPSALASFRAAMAKPVEAMLEFVLQTRRMRRRHGPEGERALMALYYRTSAALACARQLGRSTRRWRPSAASAREADPDGGSGSAHADDQHRPRQVPQGSRRWCAGRESRSWWLRREPSVRNIVSPLISGPARRAARGINRSGRPGPTLRAGA